MKIHNSLDFFLMELRRRGYSERTLSAYNFDLGKFICFLESIDAKRFNDDAEISLISDLDIKRWIDSCLSSGVCLKTMARRIASIKSFFKYFYQEKFIESNPTDRIRIPKVPKRAPSSLSQDEVRQFIAAPSPGDKDFLLNRAVLVLMYSVGLRVSELASLRVENINLERRIVVIPGKGAKERIVPLQDPVIDVLLSYFDEREKLYPESMAPKNNAFLKPSASGLVPMNVRRIQYLVEKHGKIAGLSTHVHPHLLRHSIATHLIEEGCSVEAVRQTLGHEDLATTSIYLKTASKFLKDEHNKHNPVSNLLNS